jgi:hypothetical protein
MGLGDLLAPVGHRRMPLASPRAMAPRDAAAAALAEYLRKAVWFIPAADPADNVNFSLSEVLEEWPNEDEDLNQPCAAITTITEECQAHNFTPTVLEDTWDQFGAGSVLWKTDEVEILFQLDFWITNKAERQAIAAGLAEYFVPEEGRWGIMLEGPAAYWSQPVRFHLHGGPMALRQDDSDLVLGRDRKLLVRVFAQIDDLQLRRVSELDPRINLSVNDGPAEAIFPSDLPLPNPIPSGT